MRLFISHSNSNNTHAVAIRGWLAESGWDDVFLDLAPELGIVAGERWERALSQAVHRCEAAIFLVSSDWLKSDWSMREFHLARRLNKRMFGVLIEDLPLAALPSELTDNWQTINLAGSNDHEMHRAVTSDGSAVAYVAFSASGLRRLRAGLTEAELDPPFFARPRQVDPEWSYRNPNTLTTLGPEHSDTAYFEHALGERSDNLERAIAAYEAALTIITRDARPYEWASTLIRLGNAYRKRIRGDRSDNLERAIAAYEAALTVITREALPYEWASTQNNLGLAYAQRFHGEHSDNLKRAIAAYEAALTVITRDALPYEWASTLTNLGDAYSNHVPGDRAEHLMAASLHRFAEFYRVAPSVNAVLGPKHLAIEFSLKRKLNAWINNSRPKVCEAFRVSINIAGDAKDAAAASIEFLERDRSDAGSLDLLVSVSCLDCSVKPSWQELQLPRTGDSETIDFAVTSRKVGNREFTVRVYLAKQMIQLQSLSFTVTVAEAQTQPAEAL